MTEIITQPTSESRTEALPSQEMPNLSAGSSGVKQRSFWSSLRFKATLLAVTIGTLPVLAIGFAGYRLADRIIIQQSEYNEQVHTELLADKIARFMLERYNDLQLLAKQPIFASYKFRSSATVEEKVEYLDTFIKDNQKIYQSIAFLDRDGNEIARSRSNTHHKHHPNHGGEDYFKKAINGNVFISQPRHDRAKKILLVTLSAPVKDSFTQEIVGVVSAIISVESVEDLLENFDKIGRVHLVDGDGKVFISTEDRKDLVDKEEEEEEEGTSSRVGINAFTNFINLAESLANSRSGVLLTKEKFDNEEELLGYARLPAIEALPDIGWLVLVETDLGSTFQAQRGLGNTFALGTLITIALVSAIAAVLANRSIKPIQATAAAVEKIGQGDLGVRLGISGSDELAILGANTNRMADQIQELLSTLRQTSEQLSLQNQVLSQLARNQALLQSNTKDAAKAFTEAIAQTLLVEKVSVWLYDDSRSILTCLVGYERASGQHFEGEVLYNTEFPTYFHALETETITAVNNAQNHPAVHELIESMRIAPATTAILNIPFGIEGGNEGILRCEQVETPRTWKAQEQTFVNSVANLISLCLESEFLQAEVARLLNVVSEVEQGNLTVKAQVNARVTGLVADTFNRLIEEMAKVLAQVLKTAKQISQGAKEQKQLAQNLANNTEVQSEEVKQVLHLTEQVQQKALDSAQKAKETNESLLTVRTTVEQGQQVLANLTQGITVFQKGADRMVQQMKTLGEFVGLADQFVQQQSQIALDTQVLAMNASLVAARAAEQQDPRQFAVVAREFESIANQVSQLAQQTNAGLVILEQRSAQIHKVVSVVDADVQNLGGLVRDFTKGVEQSSKAFSNVERVTDEAMQADEAVVQSSQEIVNTAQLTAGVMRDIAKLAALTAEMTQNSTKQSEKIDNLSAQLLQRIEFFHLPGTEEQVDLLKAKETNLNVASKEVGSSIAL